jgi:hypothetical protein
MKQNILIDQKGSQLQVKIFCSNSHSTVGYRYFYTIKLPKNLKFDNFDEKEFVLLWKDKEKVFVCIYGVRNLELSRKLPTPSVKHK